MITGLAVPSRISRDDFVFQFVCLSSVRLFTCFLFYTRCCLSACPKPGLKSQLEVYLVSPKHVFHRKIGLSSGNITRDIFHSLLHEVDTLKNSILAEIERRNSGYRLRS